jgi:hypothetical protein
LGNDGVLMIWQSLAITHSYPAPGTYTIAISEISQEFILIIQVIKTKIHSIQWEVPQWNLYNFYGCLQILIVKCIR